MRDQPRHQKTRTNRGRDQLRQQKTKEAGEISCNSINTRKEARERSATTAKDNKKEAWGVFDDHALSYQIHYAAIPLYPVTV